MKKNLLKSFLMMTIMLLMFNVLALADETNSGTCGDNVSWRLDDNGTLIISGAGTIKDYDCWVSGQECGCDSPWYELSSNIYSVEISEGITQIGACAFYGLTEVTSIKMPDSVYSVGMYAFSNCTKLVDIDISNLIYIDIYAFDNTAYYKNNSYYYDSGVYIETVLLESSSGSIKPGTTCIANSALMYADFTETEIPDSVISIGETAFAGNRSLLNVTIPKSVKYIGQDAFGFCGKLESIDVSADNQYFSDEDGVLFNKDKTKLMQYPSGKVSDIYIVPSEVTYIGDYSFMDAYYVYKIIIPEGVECIGQGALDRCNGLTDLIIPKTVTEIKKYAFWWDNISNIYYLGSESDWEQIVIDNTNNDCINNAIIYYSYFPTTDTEYVVSDDESIVLDVSIPFIHIPEKSNIIACGYDGDILKTVKAEKVEQKDASVKMNLSSQDVTKVKIFIWTDFDMLKPLTQSEKINIESI